MTGRMRVTGLLIVAALLLTTLLVVVGALAATQTGRVLLPLVQNEPQQPAPEEYIVVAWNDLGMHCYNPSFQDLSILPPYNTLYAQVIKLGEHPEIVTEGVTVSYSFPDNTYSVGKTDFWSYEEALFGVQLPDNVGLTGKGLAGQMDAEEGYFIAEGIPLTEYRDSAPNTRYPYMLASIVVRDAQTGQVLAQAQPVAPVSTEMHCDNCHYDGAIHGIATGRVETNILTLHDQENQEEYPTGHEGALMDRRPINCAECHSENALGAPGVAGIPSFSNAMHDTHKERSPDTIQGCYQCHPGPETQCLRDVMWQAGMDCIDCHGGMEQVASNPNPWLNEPRCDNPQCHGAAYAQNHALYRLSTGHGGLFCAACHDSPHAIAPSAEANDHIKFQALQGDNGPLGDCDVCHTTPPTGPGPHGLTAP